MWKSFLSLFILLAVVAAKAEPVQFDRVNTTMQVIADYVVVGDDQVDFAKPKFDEVFTNLQAEKVKYDLTGEIKNTPWLSGSRSEVSASCTMTADRDPSHSGIEISSKGTVKTNALAMIRQGCITGLKNLNSAEPGFEGRIRDNLQRGSMLSSLREAYELLLDSQELTVDLYQFKISRAKESIQCLKNPACSGPSTDPSALMYAEKHLANLQSIQASYRSVEVTASPSKDDVKKITLISKNPQGFSDLGRFELKPTFASITIESEEIVGELKTFSPQTLKTLDRLKKDLNQTVYGLQTGSLETKEDTYRAFRDGLYHFKRVISGEWPKH